MPSINNIFKELKQRKVFRSLAIYAGASFIILQVCSIVFPALLLPDWSMRLVVILLIIGFPTLIIFSWIYDVTPEGVVKTETNRSSSKTNYSIFILIVVVGGGLLFFFQDRLFKPAVNPKSVAVLPFDNYSPNPDDKYLSAGFTEVIIANLAKINDLMVISRTSVMRYKDKDMNLKEIAEELGVANILEGSIQRTGSKIRVVAQLIEAETDQHLWAETYDEEFEDIFSIQTSIAKEIASALKSQITESEKSVIEEKITDNTEAYEYYLRVKELRSRKRFSTGNKELRLSLLEKIIKLDPNFAEAFALLSIEHSEMVHFGFDKSQITIDLAKENIENAYSIKPGSPDVQFAFGYYYYGCQKNYLKALEHYKNALAKEPGNAKYMSYIGYAHRRYGNWDKHLKYLEEALVINPNDIDLHANLFSSYYFLRKYNKVNLTDYHAKWYRISPDDPNLYRRRAQWTFRLEGKTDNAREIIDKASTFTSDKDFLTITLRSFDYYDHKFDRLIKSYENESDSIKYFYSFIGVKFEEIAFIYWLMDEKDKAYKEAQKALKVYLGLADLDEDARYHAALSWVYALLDKPQKAIQEAKMAMELYPHAKDAFSSDQYEMTLASVYALIGEHTKALDIIEKQLVGPSGTNWWDIKYNNLFNKVFGNNPRFISIIKKDEDRFRRESTYDLNIFMP